MRGLMLLLPVVALAGCARADQHTQAKALIASNCGACHQVPGVRAADGRVGPSLAGIAHQQIIAGHFANSPQTLTAWIEHPQSMLPGNAMPEMHLTHDQARAITSYLYTLEER
jgi:cytochrome c1